MAASPLPFPELATSQVGIYFGINSNSENQPLAEDFIKRFLSPQTQQKVSEVIGNTSTVATDTDGAGRLLRREPVGRGLPRERRVHAQLP